MTPETLAALRTDLGLTAATLADVLDINRRTTERWESGSTPIPAWLPDKLAELRAEQLGEVDALAAEPGPIIIDPAGPRPVGWQRMVAARVLHRDPARIITDPDGIGSEYVIHWRDEEITVPRGAYSPAVGWIGRPSWRSLAETLTDMHVRDIDWEGVHPSDLRTPGATTTLVVIAGPRGGTRLRFKVELRWG